MGNKKLIILTGDIQTGKTTALFNWAVDRSDVAGVLTPVKEGKRFFYSIPEKHWCNMEADETDTAPLGVGRFLFSAAQFEKANSSIIKWVNEGSWKYLVIDEIGPLELVQKKGLWLAVCHLLEQELNTTIILVVRKALSNEVLLLFEAEKYSVRLTSPDEFPGLIEEHSYLSDNK